MILEKSHRCVFCNVWEDWIWQEWLVHIWEEPFLILPILVDGMIAAAGALTAARICPETVSYMLATHVSKEPAGKMILDELGLHPLIDCGMCLGEGSGAVAAMPLLDMAACIYGNMKTFEEYQIEAYKPL